MPCMRGWEQVFEIDTTLILGAHPDDGELGFGGTISKLSDQNKTIHYATFSPCNKSLPEGFSDGVLFEEGEKACEKIGIPGEHLIKKRYPVRDFSDYRQDILEDLIDLKRNLNPDLIALPASSDVHQDHSVIHDEGIRAFKEKTILGYELPWNNLDFSYQGFVSLRKSDVDRKIAALREFKSQKRKEYIDPEYLRSLAVTRGVRAGYKFAEAFEVIRWVVN